MRAGAVMEPRRTTVLDGPTVHDLQTASPVTIAITVTRSVAFRFVTLIDVRDFARFPQQPRALAKTMEVHSPRITALKLLLPPMSRKRQLSPLPRTALRLFGRWPTSLTVRDFSKGM